MGGKGGPIWNLLECEVSSEDVVNILTSEDYLLKMNYFHIIVFHLLHTSILDYKTLGRIERGQRKPYTRDETFHGPRKEN